MSHPSENLNKFQQQLAEKLAALHIDKSPFSKLPIYKYKELQKGVFSKICHSFKVVEIGMKVVCEECRQAETVEAAVLRNVEELKLPFLNEKIITLLLYNWCRIIYSKKNKKNISQNIIS